MKSKEQKQQAFWARIDIKGPDECWPFIGCRSKQGYGRVSRGYTGSVTAHRVAYEFAAGVAPGKLKVCHSCDNPPCCNPAHLWLGTQADNMADAWSKGRVAQPVLPKEMAARGERQALAKLTSKDVLAILESDEPTAVLVARFKVATPTIWSVRRGKTWRHVAPEIPRDRVIRSTGWRPVKINGVVYPTQAEAARNLGLSLHGLRFRVHRGWPGYRLLEAA